MSNLDWGVNSKEFEMQENPVLGRMQTMSRLFKEKQMRPDLEKKMRWEILWVDYYIRCCTVYLADMLIIVDIFENHENDVSHNFDIVDSLTLSGLKYRLPGILTTYLSEWRSIFVDELWWDDRVTDDVLIPDNIITDRMMALLTNRNRLCC